MFKKIENLLARLPQELIRGKLYIEVTGSQLDKLRNEIPVECCIESKEYDKDFGGCITYSINGWKIFFVINNQLKSVNYIGFQTTLDDDTKSN